MRLSWHDWKRTRYEQTRQDTYSARTHFNHTWNKPDEENTKPHEQDTKLTRHATGYKLNWSPLAECLRIICELLRLKTNLRRICKQRGTRIQDKLPNHTWIKHKRNTNCAKKRMWIIRNKHERTRLDTTLSRTFRSHLNDTQGGYELNMKTPHEWIRIWHEMSRPHIKWNKSRIRLWTRNCIKRIRKKHEHRNWIRTWHQLFTAHINKTQTVTNWTRNRLKSIRNKHEHRTTGYEFDTNFPEPTKMKQALNELNTKPHEKNTK